MRIYRSYTLRELLRFDNSPIHVCGVKRSHTYGDFIEIELNISVLYCLFVDGPTLLRIDYHHHRIYAIRDAHKTQLTDRD